MSSKRCHKDKKSFLLFLEEELNLSQSVIYNNLGWDRRRYHAQKQHEFFPFEHLESLRAACGASEKTFYSLVKRFLEK